MVPSVHASAAAPATERTVTLARANELSLTASVWGEPDHPGVLLLHGFGQSRLAWRETGQILCAAGFYAVAADARGHGDSGWAPGGVYRLNDFVCDVQKWAGELPHPVMVGASMGGMVGMLAQTQSSRALFRALVLVDIVPRWNTSGVRKILDFMAARPDGFASLEEVTAEVSAYLPHRSGGRAIEGIKPYLRETEGGRWVWRWDPRLLNEVAPGYEPYHARLMAAARTITCPVLLVSGAKSEVVKDDGIAEFFEAVPHAEHVRVKDARHMVMGDANSDFTAAVLTFLEKLSARKPYVSLSRERP